MYGCSSRRSSVTDAQRSESYYEAEAAAGMAEKGGDDEVSAITALLL
jgi:hypothetical protein